MSGPSLASGVFQKGGGSGSGNVAGPGAAVDGNFPSFDGSDGKLLRDSGSSASSFATAAQGAAADTALQPGAQIPWGDVTEKPSIGTVTSVNMTLPTGLQVSGGPITTSGSFTVSYASGYQGYTTVEAAKLSGIASGATANQTDAYLLSRANHTGTQLAATISDFSTAADARITAAVGSTVQAYSAKLSALAGQTWAADQITYQTSTSAVGVTALTAFARTLLDDANQATAQATLGLVPGTNVQAYDAELAALASLTSAADRLPYFTGSGTAALLVFTAAARTMLGLTPTNGYVITGDGTTWTASAAVSGPLPTFIAREEQTNGTSGGSSVASTWNARTLNTVKVNTISGASLASNQITLPAGTYEVFASAPAKAVGGVKTRLWNVTDSALVSMGTTERSGTSGDTSVRSLIDDRFTLAATKNVRLETYTQTSVSTTGLGEANGIGSGIIEVYSEIVIRKVA